MNPEENQEVQKPQFEGEEMKMPENSSLPEPVVEKKVATGPLLVVLGVSLIIILAGLYYWFVLLSTAPTTPVAAPVERPTAAENNEPESTTAEVQTESMQVLSTSDEIAAIEADLESTDLDSLASELDTIDAELETAATIE